jgi:hypothetical protein
MSPRRAGGHRVPRCIDPPSPHVLGDRPFSAAGGVFARILEEDAGVGL